MKILVLNGSPRPSGNTVRLVERFKRGAESVGHDVSVLQVGTMNIRGCVGCEFCHTHDQCAIKDDMQKVYDAFQDAEIIVFACGVYYWSFTPQLQAVISRIYAIDKPQKAKQYAMILTSASPNVYDSIVSQYKSIVSYFGAKDAGIITAFGAQRKDDNKLEEVYNLGRNIKG